MKLTLEVELQRNDTIETANLTVHGSTLNITFTEVARTIGNEQYPRTHTDCKVELN